MCTSMQPDGRMELLRPTGIYLLYALGYNFSVAVRVGFIALFGTAVQTGMVIVIYLEEAVVRKREAVVSEYSAEPLPHIRFGVRPDRIGL